MGPMSIRLAHDSPETGLAQACGFIWFPGSADQNNVVLDVGYLFRQRIFSSKQICPLSLQREKCGLYTTFVNTLYPPGKICTGIYRRYNINICAKKLDKGFSNRRLIPGIKIFIL